MKTRRYCKACPCVTSETTCPFCDEPTVSTNKIKRFPRNPSEEETRNDRMAKMIEKKTAEFGCRGEIISIKTGPIITQFNFKPYHFTRIKNLKSLHEDLALVLAVDNVSIARIPGQAAVSIMIPNRDRKTVHYQDTLKDLIAQRSEMALPLNLGIDSLGNPVIVDLAKLPHILIAGSTGSGKSVLAKTIITSLLYVRSPKEMNLVLIDPKQVELFQFAELPHVRQQPVSSVFGALETLERLETEMRRRMQYIHAEKCVNLAELNAKRKGRNEEPVPFVVVVIDEIADLIVAEKREITDRLTTLSSIARASGIHLIAITQRPSVDILSGKIKVNFPARLCFKVPAAPDSKTVLGMSGAEQLMQSGDAYAQGLPGYAGNVRIHTPLIEKPDIKRMMDLSLKIGHVHKVPADATQEELAEMLKAIKQGQIDEAKAEIAEGKSIVDSLMEGNSSKKGLVM